MGACTKPYSVLNMAHITKAHFGIFTQTLAPEYNHCIVGLLE